MARDAVQLRAGRDARLLRLASWAVVAFLVVGILLPLLMVLTRSISDDAGQFCGLRNFATFFRTPSLSVAVVNSAIVTLATTVVVTLLAFVYAYGLTRSRMPLKKLFRLLAFAPLFAPSLLPAIALIFLFGKQGMAKQLLFGHELYGPVGIVLASAFWTFPHALIIMTTALEGADARLYEAATVLGASRWRRFLTVTLGQAKTGIVSAALIVFTLALTDVGVPKVVGGNYSVLATEIYKQVIGQQDFQLGAVVACLLLAPALVTFAVDRWLQRRHSGRLDVRAVPYIPAKCRLRDWSLFAACSLIGLAIVAVLGTALYGSLVRFWPYNLDLSLVHYGFNKLDGGGWRSLGNSLTMAAATAAVGTAVIYLGAYLTEKATAAGWSRKTLSLLAYLPLPVPGLVLGLGYVFFFNHPHNPFGMIYGTMVILTLSTIIHFYTVAHVTCRTALQRLDPEFERVGDSLGVSQFTTLGKVTIPMTLPAIIDVATYLFVNAMTTVSAVVFLCAPTTVLASVSILNLDDAGDTAPAAAFGIVIVACCICAKLLSLAARAIADRARWRAST